MAHPIADRFGIYVLPGRINDPRRGPPEAVEAENAGLGAVWLSERHALKEPAVLCGAMVQATSRIRIWGTIYVNMRHPLVSASIVNLLQALSGDRFGLLLARSVPETFTKLGLPPLTFPRLADFISIARRLWAGETVSYEGPLGAFPNMRLTDRHAGKDTPIAFTAIGPKALAFAGAHCDGVLLHPFLTAEAVARSAAIVRQSAEQAGRDPAKVRIYATVVAAPDLAPEEEEAIVGGRAVTYFQNKLIGGLLVAANRWDSAALDKVQNHPMFTGERSADRSFTRDQLVGVSRELPRWWLTEGAAIGSSAQCAARMDDYFAAGADEILLHGLAPAQALSLLESHKARA